MRRPLNGIPVVTQGFGESAVDYAQFGLKGHHGVDYLAGIGTAVYAPESGRIEFSRNGVTDKYTGRFAAGETIVLIGTHEHWFMHLDKRFVSEGQQVKEGDVIGNSGNTGFTTGPHLHWGVRPLTPNMNNGYRGFINPADVLNQEIQGGTVQLTEEAVKTLYRRLFNREGDPGGVKNYTGKTLDFALGDMLGSQEFKNIHVKTVERIVEKPVEVIKEIPGGTQADPDGQKWRDYKALSKELNS